MRVVYYGCEACSLPLREDRTLQVSEHKVSRKLYGSKKYEVGVKFPLGRTRKKLEVSIKIIETIEQFGILYNEGLSNLYRSPSDI